MSTATSTAEWIGSGVIGTSALLLVAVCAKAGENSAHQDADVELAAYKRARAQATPRATPAQRPAVLDIPAYPDHDPTCHVPEDTVQLTAVSAYRARHRKEPACT